MKENRYLPCGRVSDKYSFCVLTFSQASSKKSHLTKNFRFLSLNHPNQFITRTLQNWVIQLTLSNIGPSMSASEPCCQTLAEQHADHRNLEGTPLQFISEHRLQAEEHGSLSSVCSRTRGTPRADCGHKNALHPSLLGYRERRQRILLRRRRQSNATATFIRNTDRQESVWKKLRVGLCLLNIFVWEDLCFACPHLQIFV